jgi:ABC-type multidrug transport system fused ATPase/permease subunit
MTSVFDLAHPVQGATRPATPPRYLKRKATRAIVKGARLETKALRRLFERFGVPAEYMSGAIPALSRCLLQSESMLLKTRNLITLLWTIIFIIPWVLLGPIFKVSASDIADIGVVCGFLILLLAAIVLKIWPFEEDKEYLTYAENFVTKYSWVYCLLIAFFLALVIYVSDLLSNISLQNFLIAVAQVFITFAYFWLVSWSIDRILVMRAPELVLVRALVDAFELTIRGHFASWRSIAERSKVAKRIHQAAYTLEGPIARKFIASAGEAEATAIQERFLMAGAALRAKVAWLATPQLETRAFLARALARELLVVAKGDLDRLEYAELKAVAAPSVGWFARLRTTAGWITFGFGPAIFLLVGKWAGWITDAATTGLLVQFAGLCVFVAVLSAADPAGFKDRLGSVTGTGAALFGWKRPEKPENKD